MHVPGALRARPRAGLTHRAAPHLRRSSRARRRRPHTRCRLVPGRPRARVRGAPARAARAARRAARRGSRPASCPTSSPRRASVREGDWRVAPVPADIADRRVEITGPADRKMMINALNSGARVFMADFEDANSPTWANCIEGQRNLRDAVERTIELDTRRGQALRAERRGRRSLVVRPRGWHLDERHVVVDGAPMSGVAVRLRAVLLPQRRADRRGNGPLLLPAEARDPPRGAALERRLRLRRRSGSASRAARSGRPS